MENTIKQHEFACEEWKPFNAAEISAQIKQGLSVQVCNSYGQIFVVDSETEANHTSYDWRCYSSRSEFQGDEAQVEAFDNDGYYYADWERYGNQTQLENQRATQMLVSVFAIRNRKVTLSLTFSHFGESMDTFTLPFSLDEVQSHSVKVEEHNENDKHFSGVIECVTYLGTAMKIIKQQYENSGDEYFSINDY